MEKPWKLRELENYKVEKLKRNRKNGQKNPSISLFIRESSIDAPICNEATCSDYQLNMRRRRKL
jgi:hypothetical protein